MQNPYTKIGQNDNLPNSIKMPTLGQNFAKYKIRHPKNCPNTFKILAKWRNFAKSGHTDRVLACFFKISKVPLPMFINESIPNSKNPKCFA